MMLFIILQDTILLFYMCTDFRIDKKREYDLLLTTNN